MRINSNTSQTLQTRSTFPWAIVKQLHFRFFEWSVPSILKTREWILPWHEQQIGSLNFKLLELYFALSISSNETILCNLQAWGMANAEHQAMPKMCTQDDLIHFRITQWTQLQARCRFRRRRLKNSRLPLLRVFRNCAYSEGQVKFCAHA